MEFDPHIVVVTETWWNSEDQIPLCQGYASVQTRPKESRGVAVFYRPCFSVKFELDISDDKILMGLA